MKAIIAGAGIGGLTAALSLNKIGVEVKVFESVSEIRPLGVGINILPHASRELIALGLQSELDKFAIRTRSMQYFTRRGKLVLSVPCGEYAGYNWPQYSLHRGEFQMLLLNTFKKRAGEDSVVTGCQLADFQQNGNGVSASFIDPKTGNSKMNESADILIGADGLHSTARKKLYPNEGAPVYANMVCFRGSVKDNPYLDGESMIVCGDKRLRLVSYPISRSLQEEGRSHINWIAAIPFETDTPQEEDWNKLAKSEELIKLYQEWNFDWLDVPKLITQTEKIFEFPVYDRDPLKQWTFDRVTLMGDAAHPLIPVSSSGAVHAIIDGRALAYALGTNTDPVSGLKAYEEDRLSKANQVVMASRQNGPDEVLEIVKDECPEEAEDIYQYVDKARLETVIDDFKERSGFGIDKLNNLASYDV
ncbi:MAG: 2-polyprenyl-6-methoxyphenol hydroxylase-like FAD-dependent oxidoreductase [Gammaproteobacteria bacterium]|jgi:2-polyprenyl-6-methoxyphenol hydroxylase-like FAD-dependent oxidoreductase